MSAGTRIEMDFKDGFNLGRGALLILLVSKKSRGE
jgi:hypothetical protein